MTLSNFVTTEINYAVPPKDGSKPLFYSTPGPNAEIRRNYESLPHEVQVENLRGREHTVSLDKNGFAFIHAPAQHKAFLNDAEVEKEYYPEVVEHIKKFTGASRVVIFDHSESPVSCLLIHQLIFKSHPSTKA